MDLEIVCRTVPMQRMKNSIEKKLFYIIPLYAIGDIQNTSSIFDASAALGKVFPTIIISTAKRFVPLYTRMETDEFCGCIQCVYLTNDSRTH